MSTNDLLTKYEPYVLQVAPFRTPVISHGEGNSVWDSEKKEYLDMMSGQFCLAFGHSYPPFVEAIHKQMKLLTHTNTLSLTTKTLEACKELASVTHPTLNKSILLSTGAEAVEFALRYAKFATGKNGIVSIRDGYHGLTLETQSISSGGQYAAPKTPETYSIETPDWDRKGESMSKEAYYDMLLQKAEAELKQHEGTIAAFVAEPVISVGGMIYPDSYYFIGLKKLAEKHKALFIFDECQTGLGRTGTWFAYENTGIVPDILVLAKIAGNGMAVSAVVVTDNLAKRIEHKLIHFSSHQNDPLSAAALHFVITHMKEQDTLTHVQTVGNYLVSELKKLAKTQSMIENPRGRGLMIGFDLPDKLFSQKRNPGQELISAMEQRGVIIQAIRQGRTVRILPSFVTTTHHVDTFIQALSHSLAAIS